MSNDDPTRSGADWSQRDVELTVADYFEMLRLDLLGQPYGKTKHRNRLMPQLDNRSRGSVEFKHQKISAVLVQMGYPYINGYKPRGNFQALLAGAGWSISRGARIAGPARQVGMCGSPERDSRAPCHPRRQDGSMSGACMYHDLA